jgi:hypothetical protein
MKFEIDFNGTPAEFGVAVDTLSKQLVAGGVPLAILINPSRLPPFANPVSVYVSGAEGGKTFGIIAEALPGRKTRLFISAPDADWPALEPQWTIVRIELERQGRIGAAPLGDSREALQGALETARREFRVLNQQKMVYGDLYAPPELLVEWENKQREIADLEARLDGLGERAT